MAIESAEDRAAMLADFGLTVTASFGTFTAIFDHDYVETQGVNGTAPLLVCRTEDITSLAVGDALTVDGGSYQAAIIEADGTGMSQVILERVA